VTDVASALGTKYGGWYPGLESYGKTKDGKFVALPLATIGNALCYRESWVKEAGFSEFPTDTKGFLELAKALKAKGHPPGFAHGKAVGDGNNYAHWLVWSHGGKMARYQQQPRLPGGRHLADRQWRVAVLLGQERSEAG
jgi:multiple sugar transport system substrate-binding protein